MPKQPKLYVVTKPDGICDDARRPFGECLEVVKVTAQMVTVRGSRWGRGPDGITRIYKRTVLFFTDEDLSEDVRNANNQCKENYDNLVALVKATRTSMEEAYRVSEPD